jgi:acyl-CoA thioester hydrolase
VRVYWEDTDAGGIVYYANHLKFFERARTEWLRSLGVGQEALRRELGIGFVVAESRIRYLAPARLDDLLEVSVVLTRTGAASLEFAQQSRRDGALLAEATIRIGCVAFGAAGTFRPCRVPDALVAALAQNDSIRR